MIFLKVIYYYLILNFYKIFSMISSWFVFYMAMNDMGISNDYKKLLFFVFIFATLKMSYDIHANKM